mmetsp:Transcript_4779/g.7273  ORF Transcript_4779/g.7273 Transcript_4779/m.7273 type:complete len:119 (+) Transcript_4779:380-736(+)
MRQHVTAMINQQAGYKSNHGLAVWVMQALYELCSGIKGTKHPIEGDVKALQSIFNCKQYNKSLPDYHDEFREAVKTITLCTTTTGIPYMVFKFVFILQYLPRAPIQGQRIPGHRCFPI